MVYLSINTEQRKSLREAIPAHALRAASKCHNLGIGMRVRVRYKTDDGRQFETDQFCDMRNLIRHYKSYGKRDLLGYAEQALFVGYKRYRLHHGTTEQRASSQEIAEYKKMASVTRPCTNTKKGTTQKWAYALEYPDVRQFKANEVHREAPLSQMRRVIYDIEQAAEIYRNEPANRGLWEQDLCAKNPDGSYPRVKGPVERYTHPQGADAWTQKAKRHCDLYYEMLAEWVEENGRELNLRAVMWNLYYNKFQSPVNEYIHMVRDGRIMHAIMQFNYCHTKYLKHKSAGGWAKLRYWTFCHFPNRISKIVAYWQEAAVKTACKPPNGRLFREQFQEWTGDDEISEADQKLLEQGAILEIRPIAEPAFEELFPPPLKMDEETEGTSKKRKRVGGPHEESGSETEEEEEPRRVRVARSVSPLPPLARRQDSDESDSDE